MFDVFKRNLEQFICTLHSLQSCKSSLLLSIIQQHFAIEGTKNSAWCILLLLRIVCRCTSAASGDHPATATAAVAKADGRRSSVRSKMGSSSSSVSTGRPSDQAETDPKPPSSKVGHCNVFPMLVCYTQSLKVSVLVFYSLKMIFLTN